MKSLGSIAGTVVLAILLAGCGGGSDDGTPAQNGEPQVVSPDEIAAVELSHPIYWVGERDATSLELTVTDDERSYVRYLDEGVEAGDPAPGYLTVGTYPLENAAAALTSAAKNTEDTLGRSDDGAVLLISKSNPGSIYVAYPGPGYEIEVFSPDPVEALELASSGALEPIK